MELRLLFLFFAMLPLISCNDDAERREIENARDAKKKEAVFLTISKAWEFRTQPVNSVSESMSAQWEQWRLFIAELQQKPQSTIGAFRKKAENLSIKAKDLNTTIPSRFDKPEVRSRISVLTTKINSLNLYMSLDNIPENKVVSIISSVNTELSGIQFQLGEIVRRSAIPREEGESDMIRMLDTSRAIPNTPVKNVP